LSVFPEGFLWGASTAAHQVEGEQRNNWSEWEPENAELLSSGANSRLSPDVPRWKMISEQAQSLGNYISGTAADHHKLSVQDIRLMKQLNLTAYRFSVEWSRIEPQRGKFDEKVLNHYLNFVRELKENNIEPIVVLHHFTNPLWFEELGGWHSREAPELFGVYAAKVVSELKSSCNKFLTFNEVNAYVLSRYLGGGIWAGWPGAETNIFKLRKALSNFTTTHKAVYKQLHETDNTLQIGIDHGYVIFKPQRLDPVTLLFAKISEYVSNELFSKKIRGFEDILGVHYYVRMDVRAGFTSIRKWVKHYDSDKKTDMGWGIYPRGIYEITQKLKSKNLPIYITENGLADGRDMYRAEFIADHLHWLHQSIQDGADVRGYFHWSLFDNFEWSEGYWPKFGLITVNKDTQERTIKGSAAVYAQIAKNNRLSD